ncbi:MAG: hypothetical protein DRO15_05435 [Thermoprotei archaeon]|nr:MAG: hypothetical protein DRO15_05435 [Thermoprotei archaeon]
MKFKPLLLIALISIAIVIIPLISFTQAEVNQKYIVIGGEIKPIEKTPIYTPAPLVAFVVTAIAVISAVIAYKLKSK